MIFSEKNIILDQEFNSQDQVFEFLSSLAYDLGVTSKVRTYYKALTKREKESTTGFENGFAIPHGIAKGIKKPSLFFMRLAHQGVNWKAMDQKNSKYIFALAIPAKDVSNIHIDILSKIAVAIIKEDFQEIIKNAQSKKEVFLTINNKIMEKE